MTDVIPSLRYLTNIITTEFGELYAGEICYHCGIIHESEPDTRCTLCNVNYCMKSWCINDYADLDDNDLLIECLNQDNEYEFRCAEHADICKVCGENSTDIVCVECSVEQIALAAKKHGYSLKKIKKK